MIRKEDVFKIGKFAKTHGVKGELSLLADGELFDASEDPYVICEIDGILVPFFIESYRDKSDSVVLVKLECIDSGEAAREFVNLDVYYPLAQAGKEDLINSMAWDSLVGFTVFSEDKSILGIVTHVDESTLNVLLQIEKDGKTFLFPAVEELVADIDYPNKQMVLIVPEGLLDL